MTLQRDTECNDLEKESKLPEIVLVIRKRHLPLGLVIFDKPYDDIKHIKMPDYIL